VDHGSKQVDVRDLILKNPSQKRAGGVAQGLGPEFKRQYCKNEKKKKDLEGSEAEDLDDIPGTR
jgi:hypothetical protein